MNYVNRNVFLLNLLEKGTLVYCWWECIDKLMHFGEQYGEGSLKTKNRVTKDPAIPLLGRYLEKRNFKNIHAAHSSIIYNSQEMEAT